MTIVVVEGLSILYLLSRQARRLLIVRTKRDASTSGDIMSNGKELKLLL